VIHRGKNALGFRRKNGETLIWRNREQALENGRTLTGITFVNITKNGILPIETELAKKGKNRMTKTLVQIVCPICKKGIRIQI